MNRAAVFLASTALLVSCDPSPPREPRGAAPQAARTTPASRTETPTPTAGTTRALVVIPHGPDDHALPAGPVAHGLMLPAGSELTASNHLGDDYLAPYDVTAVLAHVRSQLEEIRFQDNGTSGGRFVRVTPRGSPPTVKLYVLVLPRPGRGTMIRVLRLPAEEPTPEARAEALRRFSAEQGQLD